MTSSKPGKLATWAVVDVRVAVRQAAAAAYLGGWTRFVSMQNQYNLLRRQDERELMAMCADTGVGLIPYSPQGKGRLARPWGERSHRSDVDHADRAGLGATQSCGVRSDSRPHQDPPPARSGRRA